MIDHELTRRSLVGALGASAVAAARKPPAPTHRPLKLILTGQSLILHDACAQPWPGMADLARLLGRADMAITDLEVAIKSASDGPPTRDLELLHAAPPEVLDCLKRLNLTLLATANNHAYDLNTGGILGTLQALEARGLAHAGTGRTLAEASAPAYRDSPHGKVALIAMATGAIREGGAASPERPGVNEVRRGPDGALDKGDLDRVMAAIETASRQADATVLCHHNHYWEPKMEDVPTWQRALAHQAIEAGANAFLGHGAPVVQPVETHKRRPIFYNLGNLFFQTATKPGKYPPEAWKGLIAECDMASGELANITLHPVALNAVGRGGEDDVVTRGLPSITGPSRRV